MNYKNKYLRGLFLISAISSIILLVCCVSTTENTISTKRFFAQEQTPQAIVKIAVDYPVSGSSPSIANIQSQIVSLLDNCDAKKYISAKPKVIISQTAQNKCYQMTHTGRAEDNTQKYQSEYFESITKLAETEKFITFAHQIYTYDGGAHGLTVAEMLTFQKSDGKRINKNILQKESSPELKSLLAQGLRAYFSSFGEDLAIFPEFDINNMPLPENQPFLTNEGVGFIYSQYEIAPYASGQPAFVVPYRFIRPYLTEEIAAIIPQNDNISEITAFSTENPWQK